MTTLLVRLFAVICGAQVQRAPEWREQRLPWHTTRLRAGAGRLQRSVRGQHRLGGFRGTPESTDDSRAGHQRPSAVARYVLRRRCGPRRGGGHGPRLPPAGQARFLFGGSTGTVVSGATSRLTRNGACGVTAAIAPDLGERYIDTVYQSNCGEDLYGPDVLNSVDLSTAHRPV